VSTARRVAAVAVIDCPHGVVPERMPKADATGLAPKKSAGFCFRLLALILQAHRPQPSCCARK
jgi:hypothetical protein